MNTTAEMAWARFEAAARLTATELQGTCHVYRDDEKSFSAIIEADGRFCVRHLNDEPPAARYAVNLAGTFSRYGLETIDVMVENEHMGAVTGEARLSNIETQGAEFIEPLCERIGINPYA